MNEFDSFGELLGAPADEQETNTMKKVSLGEFLDCQFLFFFFYMDKKFHSEIVKDILT